MNSSKKLVAIFFADIQNYTALMQKDEKLALKLLGKYQEELEKNLDRYGGQLIKNYGDGSICLFSSSSSAVACAMALQEKMRDEPAVPLRIGLHLGDVTLKNEDVYGDAVNIASRIESMGVPGNVLLSRSMYEKVRNQREFQFKSLGNFPFKNIEENIEVFALANEGFVVPKKKELKGKFKSPTSILHPRNWAIAALVLLVIALSLWFFVDRYGFGPNQEGEPISMAVLPFANLSPDPDQDYFVAGMQEELISHLGKISDLRVISRMSTQKYKSSDLGATQIADELGVKYLVGGSVMKVKDSIRIQVQLLEGLPREVSLWNRTFDRKLTNILDMHSEVTREIVRSINIKLKSSYKSKLSASREVDQDAYEALLKGKYIMSRFSPKSTMLGMKYIEESISLDPNFAEAYATMGKAWSFQLVMGMVPPIVAGEKMKYYADKSLELDSLSSEAHSTLAAKYVWSDWNWELGEKYFLKSLDIDGNAPGTHMFYGHFLACMGRFEEAIEQGKTALTLDPNNAFMYGLMAIIQTLAGEFETALTYVEQGFEIDPYNGFVMAAYQVANHGLGNYDVVYKVMLDRYTMMGDLELKEAMETGFQSGGEKMAFKELVNALLERQKKQFVKPMELVALYDIIGDVDNTLNWIDSVYVYRDHDMVYIKNSSMGRKLWSNPRFQEQMKKMNFPREEPYLD